MGFDGNRDLTVFSAWKRDLNFVLTGNGVGISKFLSRERDNVTSSAEKTRERVLKCDGIAGI